LVSCVEVGFFSPLCERKKEPRERPPCMIGSWASRADETPFPKRRGHRPAARISFDLPAHPPPLIIVAPQNLRRRRRLLPQRPGHQPIRRKRLAGRENRALLIMGAPRIRSSSMLFCLPASSQSSEHLRGAGGRFVAPKPSAAGLSRFAAENGRPCQPANSM